MISDTGKLLKECNSGCKMAIASMDQVNEFLVDPKLKEVVRIYKGKHEKLELESAKMLAEEGVQEKASNVAQAFSWVTTEMKMMLKTDTHEAAKIMMDGCNMGIQSVSKYLNQFQNASEKSKKMAENIVKVEEEFMKEMEDFM